MVIKLQSLKFAEEVEGVNIVEEYSVIQARIISKVASREVFHPRKPTQEFSSLPAFGDHVKTSCL